MLGRPAAMYPTMPHRASSQGSRRFFFLFCISPIRALARIAVQVGYNEQSYFDKVFKRYEGITPAQYRKKVLE